MGWEQPRRSFLSSRRWIRRLLLASFRRMLGFTRNPSGRRVLEKADTSFNTGKAWGFRVPPHFQPPRAGDFACIRASCSFRRDRASRRLMRRDRTAAGGSGRRRVRPRVLARPSSGRQTGRPSGRLQLRERQLQARESRLTTPAQGRGVVVAGVVHPRPNRVGPHCVGGEGPLRVRQPGRLLHARSMPGPQGRGSRMIGMRSWTGFTSSFTAVIRIVHVRSGGPVFRPPLPPYARKRERPVVAQAGPVELTQRGNAGAAPGGGRPSRSQSGYTRSKSEWPVIGQSTRKWGARSDSTRARPKYPVATTAMRPLPAVALCSPRLACRRIGATDRDASTEGAAALRAPRKPLRWDMRGTIAASASVRRSPTPSARRPSLTNPGMNNRVSCGKDADPSCPIWGW
jgi:hypothetical protein